MKWLILLFCIVVIFANIFIYLREKHNLNSNEPNIKLIEKDLNIMLALGIPTFVIGILVILFNYFFN